MNTSPGDPSARADFESATTPEETEACCDRHLPTGRHLGDPVDYGVYVIGKLAQPTAASASWTPRLPDFNLDADRGYGWHCWNWARDPSVLVDAGTKFQYEQPCTVPELFCNGAAGPHYNPLLNEAVYYLGTDATSPPCPPTSAIEVSQDEMRQAGMTPTGGPFQ